MSAIVLDLGVAARARTIPVPDLPHLREAARRTWRARMVNEYASSRVFTDLAEQLAFAGFPDSDVRACTRFSGEERRHGVLCGAVVASLGGEARAMLHVGPPMPRHEDVDRTEAVLRNVLSVACLSETVAVALIGAEREEMDPGPLRDVLTTIWSDEIGHARFGWRLLSEHLPSLGRRARARMSRYLGVALAHLVDHELAHLPLQAPPSEGAALGLCNGADARELFFDTVETVILPRLAALGLKAPPLAWEHALRPHRHEAPALAAS
jgi:hypothetical protein